jgi:hypothetical protein
MDHNADDSMTVRALTVAYYLLGRGHRPLRAVRRASDPAKIDWVFSGDAHRDLPRYQSCRDRLDSLVDQIEREAEQ